jgi:DNA-binding response OmpR family regulator
MSHRLLIIEDEEKMAKTLEKGFTKAGYTITLINNGIDARIADITNYDAVILDWMLPGFSGLDVLHFWRMQKKMTPVLMLTAKEQVMDKVAGLNFGADDYMVKVFDWEELLARVRVLIRRNQETQMKVGNIVYDRVKNEFYENNQPIKLTKTEHRILAYFFDHPNRVLTKDVLKDALWGIDNEPQSNVIERHVKEIRKKCTYDPIQTLHDMGYRLRSDTTSA